METPGIWSIIVITNLTSLTFCNGTYSVVSSDASSDDHPEVDYQPRHVHLALGENSDTMVVTWSTVNITSGSVVLIGKDKLTDQFTGTSTRFVDGGELQATQFIHTVKLTKLEPNRYLMYSVGSDEGWSPLLRMKTPQVGPDWSPVIALFGDMGNENAVSLPHLQKGALEDAFDMIIHVGDFAYDMYEDNGTRGDLFMEQIEPIASMIPYMTCPGNHEYHYNFSNYKGRFSNSMPGDAGDLFYTFTIGPVRFFSGKATIYINLIDKKYFFLY
jgi:phosphodiesterase/alkaline phosphatase D-like protein